MLNLKILIKIFQPAFVKRLLSFLLTLAIVPLADCILIIRSADLLGEYLFIALLALLSLAGFVFSFKTLERAVLAINRNLETNVFSEEAYSLLPGGFLAAYLLIMPGIVSTLVGIILSCPPLRRRTGRALSRFLRIDWKEIHEYMNIID